MNENQEGGEHNLLFCSIDSLFQTILAMKAQLGPDKNINTLMFSKRPHTHNDCHKKNKQPNKQGENSDLDFSKSIHNDFSDPSILSDNDNGNDFKINPQQEEKRKESPKEEDNKPINKASTNAKAVVDKDIYTFKYFIVLKVLLFAAATITNCYLFVLILCLAPSKNNTYCFDQVYKEFAKCPPKEIYKCANGRNDHIYNNSIYNDDQLAELIEVNEKYLNFYHKDFGNFIYYNTNINPTFQTTLSYSVRIALTKNEEFLFKNIFRLQCSNESFSMLVVIVLGLIAGNIFFGYSADVFGRKKILSITLVIQGIGGFIIVLACYTITSKGSKEERVSYEDSLKMFQFDHSQYDQIKEYVESKEFTNLSGFEKTGLYSDYINFFNLIKSEVLESNFIYKAFKDHHFLFLFGLIVLSFGNSANYCIIRAYLLEYSLCEDYFFSDCVQIHLTEPLGLIISYAMVLFINSFPFVLIIISSLSILLSIAIHVLLCESLRFYFEYSRFDLITSAVKMILNNHSNFFNPTKGRRLSFMQNIKKENEEEYNTMIANAKVSFWKSFIMSQSINSIRIDKLKKRNRLLIKKEYFYAYPRLILSLFRLNPSIQNEFLTTLSFISIAGCVHYISICKITSSLMLPRSTIHHNYFFNMLPVYVSIIYALSLYGFSMILKVLNMHYVFLISFTGAILFSFSFELVALFPGKIKDLNIHYYSSSEILHESHSTTLIALYFCQLFFVLSIKFACFYYMTKLTKTVYRCTFYGLWNCLFHLSLLLAFGMEMQFDNNLFYVALFSILGLFSLYFTSQNTGIGITSDLHEIKKKESKKVN